MEYGKLLVEGASLVAGGVGAIKDGALLTEKITANLVEEGVGDTVVAGTQGAWKDYIDVLSPEVKQHILYGDKPGSGGHMWPGRTGETVFSQTWSADKIIHEVGDITTPPSTKWYAQTGTGGVYTSKGDPAKWVAYEVRDGIRMRVVYQPAIGKVVTAFPDNAPIPPYKSIK